jgi:alkylation response protein AidB-like acyl-CoA dehydrogenase
MRRTQPGNRISETWSAALQQGSKQQTELEPAGRIDWIAQMGLTEPTHSSRSSSSMYFPSSG